MNKRIACVCCMLLFTLARVELFATHNRAGELTYEFTHPNTLKVTITTYTKISSYQADRDSLPIHWGDGSPDEYLYRTNGPTDNQGYPGGDALPGGVDIKKNIYIGVHTYPGSPAPPNNFYVISMTDPNRNSDIVNIANSVGTPFYIEDTIFYPTNVQNIGYNHSPIMLNPPIDFANVGDTFLHNPAAYDPDGDSLDFQQIIPKQGLGADVNGYYSPADPFFGGPSTETLDHHTGQYMWAVPQSQGIYNVAFIVREYRRGYLLGTLIRDMQIIVKGDNTHPPHLVMPHDTCVRAGDLLRVNVTALDPSISRIVTLSGYGGPLSDRSVFPDSLSPATFPNAANTPVTGNPVTGVFNWPTVCLDIRSQRYEVVFKAQNDYTTPLTDVKAWLIDVIPPPPLNLKADIARKKVRLHWNPYKCEPTNIFRGFSVWKRVGSNNFTPAYCETGLDGKGYTMIADKITDTSYLDLSAVGGQQLCYRILAHFSQKSPNGLYEYDKVVSVPSNEYCIYLPYDVPVITNVSVTNTDAAVGKMVIKWTKPRTGGTDLDTILNPPPYRFDLYRGFGFSFGAARLIFSVTRGSFSTLIDTVYTDTNINTQDSAFSYQVQFYSASDTVGASGMASSVYLNVYPSDTKMRLKWSYNVPWIQDSFQIFRKDGSSSLFHYISTVSASTYIDTALTNDSTYCYYVTAFGHYTSTFIQAPLVNLSEVKCGIPIDTIPPCPPAVSITNDCGNPSCDTCFAYVNNLTWQNFTDSCGFNTVKYRIYYAPDSGAMTLIDTFVGISNTSFSHVLSTSLAGCYVVTAVDRRGNESYKVNKICIDDCPNYMLPNTFSPNGDGINDLFTPLHPYRFVTRVYLKIFTRWGEKVFETTDPEIKWDGKDQKTGKDLSDGVYFYSGYFYEQTLNGEVRKPLPHKSGGGFIHLIRGK